VLIVACTYCRHADASSADPAQAPVPDLGKDTRPVGFGTLPPPPPVDRPGATWVPKRPVNANYDCLEDFAKGCHSIKDKRTCLSSRDGRDTKDKNGLKILGEPCTWCGGIACTTGSLHVCEPLDYLLNGQGKAFMDFTAKKVYTVAKCLDGRPVLPSRPEPVLALADQGRHQACGDQKVFTVPHIKDTWRTCSNFCENKASVTYPYGKLGWICIRAWYADGNTCHATEGAKCNQTFENWMDVALCQCQGKGLPNEWEMKHGDVVTTTTACPSDGGLRTVTLTSTTTTRGEVWGLISMFPWWLIWLALALCLLGLCAGILYLCFKKKSKARSLSLEGDEDMMLISRVSEGTQTPASDRSFHVGQMQQQQGAMTLVRPFETMVEVLPQPGTIQERTLSQPGQQTLFDMIDSNHDGVITRQELAAATGGSASLQAHTQSYMLQDQMNTQVTRGFDASACPTEPIMNRPGQGLVQGTMPMQGTTPMQVVPTMEMVTQTQVLQPMQAVQEQQMDLLTVTPWGYSVNHMTR